jgi:secreted trypsin-like serine protease
MKRRKTWFAGLSLGALAASVLVGTLVGRTDVAQGCSNFWVNPESGTQECLDGLSAPASASPAVNSRGSTQTNWMRDYVRERRIARSLAVSPGLTRAEIEAAMTPRIVGGSLAAAADNPFQVGLLNRSISNARNAKFCGGTLYKGKYVITAAHCSDFITANQVQVVTYSTPIPAIRRLNPLAAGGVRRNVARIDIHPGWRPATFDYDVAVWTLTASVPGGVSLASLASTDPAVGTGLLATGWGSTVEGGAQQNDLRKVTLPLVSFQNCNDANSYNGSITARMLCAGRDAGGIDTCQGDSGGPLAIGSTLHGIVSWGTGCARANKHGVYARVSHDTAVGATPGIRSWIVGKTP